MKPLSMKILYITAFFMFGSVSCMSDVSEESKRKQEYYNVTILLDLSDRITTGNQMERDIEIIQKVFNIFEERQKRMGYITSRDIFRVAVASQKGSEIDFFGLGKDLMISMRGMTKPKFDKLKAKFINGVKELYTQAENSPTTGSDIYSFFKDNLNGYIVKSTDKVKYYNKLFILTDGYLVFDKKIAANRPKGTYISLNSLKKLRKVKDWEGSFNKHKLKLNSFPLDIHNLQIQMLEVNPENPEDNVNEFDVLKKIWTIWFEDLGVYEASIVKRENHLGNIEAPIRKFLKKKP